MKKKQFDLALKEAFDNAKLYYNADNKELWRSIYLTDWELTMQNNIFILTVTYVKAGQETVITVEVGE